MRYVACWLCLIAPAAAWAQTSAKPVQLAWKFKEGEKFWIDTQTRIEQVERSGNAGITNIVQLRTITSYVVRKITPANTVELEAKIEQTRYSNNQTPDSEKMATLYGRLQGATFQITLGADHQVQKMDGYNEWLLKLNAIFSSAEVERIRVLIPETDLRNALNEGFGFLPAYQVTVGQQWRKKSDLNLSPAGILSCELTYTYRGQDRGRDKITVEVKEQGKFNPIAGNAAATSKSNFILDQRAGTIYFNNQAGKMEQSEHTYQTQGLVAVPSQEIPGTVQNIKIVTRVTVKQALTSRPPR